MNQTRKLLNFLKSGKTISATQAEGMFGIQNVSARVSELREQGHCVYTNVSKNGVTNYRIGRPTKRMIATAYKVHGSQIFA